MYEDIFKSIRQAAEKRRIPHYITADRTDGMFFPLFCEGRLSQNLRSFHKNS